MPAPGPSTDAALLGESEDLGVAEEDEVAVSGGQPPAAGERSAHQGEAAGRRRRGDGGGRLGEDSLLPQEIREAGRLQRNDHDPLAGALPALQGLEEDAESSPKGIDGGEAGAARVRR